MNRTLTNTHRLGHQPSRARFAGAIGQAWQGGSQDRCSDLGSCAGADPSAPRTYLARQANATDASPAASTFDGILAVPTMWTKTATRHLAPRST
jgi:hypothetical protein